METSDWAQAFERKLKPYWLAALEGDTTAYEQSLLLISQRLRGYFARRLQAMPSEVEDLVQETLLAIHLKRATYDTAYPVSSWVLAIGKYKLVDFWRRHERHEALHDDIDQTDPVELIAEEIDAGSQRDIESMLQTLPDSQRTAIELTKLKGLSVSEAAAHANMSVSAVKVNVHRGMKRLALLFRGSSS